MQARTICPSCSVGQDDRTFVCVDCVSGRTAALNRRIAELEDAIRDVLSAAIVDDAQFVTGLVRLAEITNFSLIDIKVESDAGRREACHLIRMILEYRQQVY